MSRRHHHHDHHVHLAHAPDERRSGRGSNFRGARRGRARRGEVRATILALLAERPMHGYEVITEIAERTGGTWRPSAGSVYPTLQLLADEGLLVAEEVDGTRRYGLTDAGRADLAERDDPVPWERVSKGAGREAVELRTAFAKMVAAWKQLAATGTDDQQRKAVEVLHDTRRRLYAILAEE